MALFTTGLFISFEGIDGAGKSSHIQALAQAFRDEGRAVVVTREPGGTPLSERLRELVLAEPMDALTEALLVFAARREHMVQRIAPALARGEVVLSDRFADATFAYQGAGRSYDWLALQTLELMVLKQQGLEGDFVLQPGLTLWFDLPAEVAAARLSGSRAPDKFEAQSADFFARVRAGYARRQAADPGRFAVIDANQPREQVWAAVVQALRARGFLA
jgi:dTMP kinase